MEKMLFIGVILIIIGIVFIIISTIIMGIKSKSVNSENKVNIGVGGFVGPIPFGFFSNKNTFYLWLVVLAI